jgi:hypothetical protein
MNLSGRLIHLIPVYYWSRGENVHYYTFILIQFTDFVWCNHSWLFTTFYDDDPNKENKICGASSIYRPDNKYLKLWSQNLTRSDYQARNIQELSSSHPGNLTNVTIPNYFNVVFHCSFRWVPGYTLSQVSNASLPVFWIQTP